METAERLGITKGTLANWRWRHYGPPFLRIGGRIEYRQIDVDEWRDAQREDPAEAAGVW